MPHLDAYPVTQTIPLPTDAELGPEDTAHLYETAHNYTDMMLGTDSIGRPIKPCPANNATGQVLSLQRSSDNHQTRAQIKTGLTCTNFVGLTGFEPATT
jgi:hypothetical protein